MAHPMFKPRCWAPSSTQPLRLTSLQPPVQASAMLEHVFSRRCNSKLGTLAGPQSPNLSPWLPSCSGSILLWVPGPSPLPLGACCVCEVGQRRETSNFGLLTAATLQSVLSGCGAGSAGVHWRTGQQSPCQRVKDLGGELCPSGRSARTTGNSPYGAPLGTWGLGGMLSVFKTQSRRSRA